MYSQKNTRSKTNEFWRDTWKQVGRMTWSSKPLNSWTNPVETLNKLSTSLLPCVQFLSNLTKLLSWENLGLVINKKVVIKSDWGFDSLLVCFVSLVDNYLVVETHQVRVDDWFWSLIKVSNDDRRCISLTHSLMFSLRRYTCISPWSRVKEGDRQWGRVFWFDLIRFVVMLKLDPNANFRYIF